MVSASKPNSLEKMMCTAAWRAGNPRHCPGCNAEKRQNVSVQEKQARGELRFNSGSPSVSKYIIWLSIV